MLVKLFFGWCGEYWVGGGMWGIYVFSVCCCVSCVYSVVVVCRLEGLVMSWLVRFSVVLWLIVMCG